MRILVTGADGFIGKKIIEELRLDAHQVIKWTRSGIDDGNEIKKYSLVVSCEVENALKVYSPDIIIHTAGSPGVGFSMNNPASDFESNYLTTHTLLFAMQKLHIDNCRFIFLSSAAVYGNPVRVPISEEDQISPLSPYALHKRAAEEICEFMSKNYALDIKIARIFSVYGPGLKKQLFWDIAMKFYTEKQIELWGTGEESRDFIYIEDLIAALKCIIFRAPKSDIYFNVANGEEITIRTASMTLLKTMKSERHNLVFKGSIREGDPQNWKADIGKIKSLGYKRKITFEEGLRNYAEWVSSIMKV